MSSTYSGDFSYAASIRSSGNQIRRTTDAIKGSQAKARFFSDSLLYSASETPSPALSRKDDDLDLDSLFRRLDKYTAEMEEVAARFDNESHDYSRKGSSSSRPFSLDLDPLYAEVFRSSPLQQSERSTRYLNCQNKSWYLDDETKTDRESFAFDQDDSVNRSSIGRTTAEEFENMPTGTIDRMWVFPSTGRNSTSPLTYSDARTMGESIKDRPSVRVKRLPRRESKSRKASMMVGHRSSSHGLTHAVPATSAGHQQLANSEGKHPSSSQQEDIEKCGMTLQPTIIRQPIVPSRELGDDLEYSDMEEPGPSFPTSWTHPPRSSSKQLVVEDSKTSIPPHSRRTKARSPTLDNRKSFRQAGFWSIPVFDDEPVPPVPSLSQSGSIATLASSPPHTPMSICSPKEDQIRREWESFAIQDGAETLEMRYKKRRAPVLSLADSDDEQNTKTTEHLPPDLSKIDTWTDAPKRGRLRRSKSIMSIFQRKSPVEKLIDLYFDDEPEEKPARPLSRWVTLSRRSSPTRAASKSPAMPPLPFASSHVKLASTG